MTLAVAPNVWGWTYSNVGNPSATPGTSVTPGASNAEGAFTQIASAANMAFDSYLMYISVGGGNSTGAAKNHLMDIGVDPAGGTSYSAVISNIVCGQSGAVNTTVSSFYFPLWIKAGSTVAVRVQGSNATAGTVRVVAKFFGRPSRPELVWSGQRAETIGTVTNSNGTSITPGNATEGSWTSLGTTSIDGKWAGISMQVDNGTITAQYTYFDLAYGDGSNKVIIVENRPIFFYGTAEIAAQVYTSHLLEGHRSIPSGSTIYARAHCSTAPATGYNCLAHILG